MDLDYLEKRGFVGSSTGDELGRQPGEDDEAEEEEEGEEGSSKSGGGEGRSTASTGSGSTTLLTPPPHQQEHSPPDTKDLVKIILLGAPAVGKTSIIQQFVWNEFWDQYYPTDRRHTYYPSVVINGRLYGLKISDLPPVPYFPVDSLYEWTDFRSYGLRTATAYVLVFDLSNPVETFRHIKCLREQMAGSRDMKNVPVVVVGNKHDRLRSPGDSIRPPAPPGSFFGVPCLAQSSGFNSNVQGPSGSTLVHSTHNAASGSEQEQANSLLLHQFQQQQNALAIAESRERRDIANIVKKHWRCGYVECSAKYNWKVVSVFKELMQAVDSMDGGREAVRQHIGASEHSVPRVQCVRSKDATRGFDLHRHQRTPTLVNDFHDALDGSKCDIL